VAEGGRRVQRETGEKGAFEIRGRERERERGSEKGERYVWEGKGELVEVERVAKVRGRGKERASCYTPRVCFSTSRHGDPLAFVTVMGWENSGREALESLPRLSGTPALTIILLKEGKTSLSGEILPILLY